MLKDKISEFFVSIDDFCIDFELEIQKHLLESSTNKSRKRRASLSDSEIMSILVMFHYLKKTASYFKLHETEMESIFWNSKYPQTQKQ